MHLFSFFNSSTSYRVRIALALKGLDYTYTGINLRSGEQSGEDYQKVNPAKGVPVLVNSDGTQVTQSLAIIQYLDDKYPQQRLIPSDVGIKTRVMELANLIACDMHPVNNLRILGYLTKTLDVTNEQKTQWYHHWIKEGFTAVEAFLERYHFGDYCFGDKPTLADCCLVPQVANAQRFGCDLTPYKKVLAIYEHCIKHPAFQAAEPSKQPDFCD